MTTQATLDLDAPPNPEPLPPLDVPELLRPDKHCLRCGRPGRRWFCSAKCKAMWKASMERWHSSLAKTQLVEAQGSFCR